MYNLKFETVSSCFCVPSKWVNITGWPVDFNVDAKIRMALKIKKKSVLYLYYEHRHNKKICVSLDYILQPVA
jgi:hypothetical protein